MVHPRTFSPGPVAVVDQTLLLTVYWTSFESRATFCTGEQAVRPLHVVNEKVKEDGRQSGTTGGCHRWDISHVQVPVAHMEAARQLHVPFFSLFSLCFGLLSLPCVFPPALPSFLLLPPAVLTLFNLCAP